MNAHTPAIARPGRRRGFTLIEMIVAIAVLAVVIGLLVVGLNRASKAANAAAGAMNVATIRTAVESFVQHFGFPPPMIKDFAYTPVVYDTTAGEKRFAVYEPAKDRDFLRREYPPKMPPNWGKGATDLEDLYDIRYSNVSLPFYLTGASEEKGAGDWQVPIDGVPGPGMLEPRQDGTFAVPADLKKPDGKSKSTGKRFDPLVDTSKGGLQSVLQTFGNDEGREFRDSKGRAYRYYQWIQGDKQGRKLTLTSLNIPRVILETMSRPEDRFKPLGTANAADHRASLPELNAATWAILWPGPDGVYGDEPMADLQSKMAITIPDAAAEREARKKAVSDNVAEVGRQ